MQRINLPEVDEQELDSVLVELVSKLKEVKNKIKERDKPKTITISNALHTKVKKYCQAVNINIGQFTEKALLSEIEERSCLIIEDNYDEKGDISNRYIKESSKQKRLVKLDKIIFDESIIFYGYSFLDSKPIYEIISDEILPDTNLKNYNAKIVGLNEVSSTIKHNMDIEVEF